MYYTEINLGRMSLYTQNDNSLCYYYYMQKTSSKHTDHKITRGQFFTRGESWLKKQVLEFIMEANCSTIYDPFAGDGHLIEAVLKRKDFCVEGCDIDPALRWKINDSLIEIPKIEDAIIVTNPPYAYISSIARKKLTTDLDIYFRNSIYTDIYLIALEKMLAAQKFVVAIVPETFINSNFRYKSKLKSITVLEENPFTDTENPVCVLCFDSVIKDFSKIEVFKNEKFIHSLQDLEDLRLVPTNEVKMKFNILSGWLALRGVDSTDDKVRIHFNFKSKINYNWDKGIKVSSRSLTLIEINIPENDKLKFIDCANNILEVYRGETYDISLSPFKGNTKNGIRRRRLDYRTARAILETAYYDLYKQKDDQLTLL